MQILIWGDNMNRKISICILAFILVFLCIVLIVVAKNGKERPISQPQTEQTSEVEPAVIANTDHIDQFCYIARIVDDRLVIFLSDGQTLYFETDIRAERLSEHVREQAMHGIGFPTEESMYDFLESYSS